MKVGRMGNRKSTAISFPVPALESTLAAVGGNGKGIRPRARLSAPLDDEARGVPARNGRNSREAALVPIRV